MLPPYVKGVGELDEPGKSVWPSLSWNTAATTNIPLDVPATGMYGDRYVDGNGGLVGGGNETAKGGVLVIVTVGCTEDSCGSSLLNHHAFVS